MAVATYILMHRGTETVRFSYDLEAHAVKRILSVPDKRRAPYAVFGMPGIVTSWAVDRWWHERGMLASDRQLRAFASAPVDRSQLTLKEKSYCLSLSDCYWVNDASCPLRWEDINYFDNDFSHDLNLVPVVHAEPRGSTQVAQAFTAVDDTTPDVDQRKKWVISDGARMFMKAGGSRFNQAAYNEVVATRLYRRLLSEDDYVPYALYRDEIGTYCASYSMIESGEELIPVYDIIRSKRKPDGMGAAGYVAARVRSTGAMRVWGTPKRELSLLTARLREVGVKDPETFLSKMFTCDYILANADRHLCNFGVIRDAETLAIKRMAPIYDTGLCLWCRCKDLDTPESYRYKTKPFRPKGMEPDRQLALFDRYDWFCEEALEGFADEAKSILDRNGRMPKGRNQAIHDGIERNIRKVVEHVRRVRGR